MLYLRFIYVPCPHTKDVLCDTLMDWNLDRKVSCITVDNCSTNDAMVESMLEKLDSSSLLLGGDLFHMRCCAHNLNLIVKDGLDVIKEGENSGECSLLDNNTQKDGNFGRNTPRIANSKY
jgi:hypothetical protein